MDARRVSQGRPEPMNTTTHHPKVDVTLEFSDPVFAAGGEVTGKMEVESKTDKGLGLSVITVELFAVQGVSLWILLKLL